MMCFAPALSSRRPVLATMDSRLPGLAGATAKRRATAVRVRVGRPSLGALPCEFQKNMDR